MIFLSSMYWLKHVLRRRHGIADFRKILFQRLHRLEQGDQSALAHGLDHQTIAVTVHDRCIARQFELHGNSDRLVAAIAEQSDVPLLRHEPPPSICQRHMPKGAQSQEAAWPDSSLGPIVAMTRETDQIR